jgi:apolipoprotein N-acyltransferase
MHADMVVGAAESRLPHTFNSAYFFRSDGAVAGTYRKMDLVMFGEYVPGRRRFPFLKRYPIRPFDFTAGRERELFAADACPLAPLICFEGIFPAPTRQVCRMGAQLIVIITSDVWSRGSNEVELHSPTAAFRAIEARKCLVRAASVGESAVYDPYGRTLASVPPWQNGVAAATVAPLGGLSFYHRYGDWPLLGASVVLLLAGLVKARRGSFVVPPADEENGPHCHDSSPAHPARERPAMREPREP